MFAMSWFTEHHFHEGMPDIDMPEQPNMLQITSSPFYLYIELKADMVEEQKAEYCRALTKAQIQIARPTEHQCPTAVKGFLKLPTHQLEEALHSIGVEIVFLGQYGQRMKVVNFLDTSGQLETAVSMPLVCSPSWIHPLHSDPEGGCG